MKAENPFASKLYQHTLPVKEEVWESIEKRLPPIESERRFPFFWFMLFASTLISGALMFGILNKKTPSSTTTVAPAYTLSPPESNIAYPNTTSIQEGNQQIQTNESTNTILDSSSEEVSNSSSSARTSTSANFSKSAGNISSRRQKSNLLVIPSGTESLSANQNNAESGVTVLMPSALTNRSSYTTSALPIADVEELNKPVGDVIGVRKYKPDPNCYKFSGLTGNYYLSVDAFAGPGFSPRSFTAVDSESSSYTQARETTENNQYAWSAGARFNFHLQSGLTLRLGLLYDQAGDIFDYTDTLATHSTFRLDSFFSADGTFLYSDSSRVLIFGTLIKKIHNTYRHLDVPLLVSYEMPIGRTSTLMLNAGPVFNLSASYEGQILDPMLHPRTITPGAQNELYAYKTSLGISLYFGAGVLFPLTDKLSGLVEPRYLYRIKPVTIQSYPLEEHRHFAGLNLGLRYYLD